MNINQLKYFQAVCQEKSVTKAAEKLHISQPCISNAIKCLEEELDVSLFFRDKNKALIITRTGEFFLEKITGILNHINQLSEDVKAFDRTQKKVIKIGCSMMGVNAFFYPFFNLQKHYPHISFDFSEATKEQILLALSEGNLDYGIIALDGEEPDPFSYVHLTDMQIHFRLQNQFVSDGYTNTVALHAPAALLPCKNYKIGLVWSPENKELCTLKELPDILSNYFV